MPRAPVPADLYRRAPMATNTGSSRNAHLSPPADSGAGTGEPGGRSSRAAAPWVAAGRERPFTTGWMPGRPCFRRGTLWRSGTRWRASAATRGSCILRGRLPCDEGGALPRARCTAARRGGARSSVDRPSRCGSAFRLPRSGAGRQPRRRCGCWWSPRRGDPRRAAARHRRCRWAGRVVASLAGQRRPGASRCS